MRTFTVAWNDRGRMIAMTCEESSSRDRLQHRFHRLPGLHAIDVGLVESTSISSESMSTICRYRAREKPRPRRAANDFPHLGAFAITRRERCAHVQ